MQLRLLILLLAPALCSAQPALNVGSKRFTESYILGEIITQTVNAAGEARAVHQQGLGNTGIVFAALKSGAIDVYPEYTGTIAFELLQRKSPASLDELKRELAPHGLGVAVPLGFGNTYALAMREERAAALGVRTISDLARHSALKPGISQEFLNRKDGWGALSRAYRLSFAAPRGLDHGLAYEALAAGQIDLIDIYTTDAKIGKYRLRVLADDRHFFPDYEAVLLYRLDLPQRFPQSWAALQKLEGRIPAQRMIELNALVEISGAPFIVAARHFLATPGGLAGAVAEDSRKSFAAVLFGADLGRLTLQHLLLVFSSLAMSVAAGIPLGILAARSPRSGYWIVSAVGMLQTIPSLALLAFLIALLGTIGTAPAILALFFYALLPIVRNTHSGLVDIAAPLRESAQALGLPEAARLRLIELPLAMRSILAGIKTSAVINVGTATIAAFIGAGGYGERIVAGLAVNDNTLLLAGAIPAAALALLIQWAFDVLEHRVLPEGLREKNSGLAQ
ncbi:MAG: glycine betaine ABC transporter substrate-binding protein [Burkholderiales bacterium]|nr:glycine betaine ABC transporter substrate-binding protein [Burkholderiales bacterium]